MSFIKYLLLTLCLDLPLVTDETINLIEMAIIQVKPKYTQNEISTFMKIIFITIQTIFFLDFGFIKCESFQSRVLMKCFFLLQNVLLSVVCYALLYTTSSALAWHAIVLIQYCIIVISQMCFSPRKTFYNLQMGLISVDTKLGVDFKSYNMEIKIICFIVATILLKYISATSYCFISSTYCIEPIIAAIIYKIPHYGFDIPIIISFFCFYSVYCRLRKISYSLLANESQNVKKYQCVYQKLFSCLENVKNTIYVTVCILFEILLFGMKNNRNTVTAAHYLPTLVTYYISMI